MVQIDKHFLPPTKLVPNSPFPLLHYRGFYESPDSGSIATQVYDVVSSNGWAPQWIFRYGETQKSHYHSLAHECMVVLTGKATIRFGVADTSEDMHENTYGDAKEDGGIELEAHAGDVFILPAGVAHKTHKTNPPAPFDLLSPGDGHGMPSDAREKLSKVELSGFTMMGSYPKDDGKWDFAVGGEGAATYAKVWSMLPPKKRSDDGRFAAGSLCFVVSEWIQ